MEAGDGAAGAQEAGPANVPQKRAGAVGALVVVRGSQFLVALVASALFAMTLLLLFSSFTTRPDGDALFGVGLGWAALAAISGLAAVASRHKGRPNPWTDALQWGGLAVGAATVGTAVGFVAGVGFGVGASLSARRGAAAAGSVVPYLLLLWVPYLAAAWAVDRRGRAADLAGLGGVTRPGRAAAWCAVVALLVGAVVAALAYTWVSGFSS